MTLHSINIDDSAKDQRSSKKEEEETSASSTKYEVELRQLIQERPKNGRAMAQLACILTERGNNNCINEAIQWANQSIKVAPNKPYGYAALSILLDMDTKSSFDLRIHAIQNALERCCCTSDDSNQIDLRLKFNLLVRLLIEPRDVEKKERWHNNHKAISDDGNNNLSELEHPSKRLLNNKEETVYQQIIQTINSFFILTTSSTISKNNSSDDCEYIGLREYRLGLFFRKINFERSVYWFQKRIEHLQPTAGSNNASHHHIIMSRFWLATFANNNNNKRDNHTTAGNNESSSMNHNSTISSISKCPPEYVIRLYSKFAERFDELLVVKLKYQTPTILCQLVNECVQKQKKTGNHLSDTVLPGKPSIIVAADLGCGTGLSGMAFQKECSILSRGCTTSNNNNNNEEEHNHVTKMIGVDLSPEMIEKAKERHCYDELYVGDVTSILHHSDKNDAEQNQQLKSYNYYSLVFACDVFVYIGDLQEVTTRVFDSLLPRGIFAFSTELLMADQAIDHSKNTQPPPYVLHSCARFAHSEHYVRTLSIDTGFIILGTKICPIRKNEGEDVIGFLIVLEKPDAVHN